MEKWQHKVKECILYARKNNMYKDIIKKLKDLKIEYSELSHEQSKSCDDSKTFREQAWFDGIWSKNIVFHAKWKYYLVTTIWDKDLKARKFKHEFGTKDIRFANQEEITKEIKWTIWSIPPFGFENKEIPIFVDKEIFTHDYFMFNPADPTKTIRIKTSDLIRIYGALENKVKIFDFSGKDEVFEAIVK